MTKRSFLCIIVLIITLFIAYYQEKKSLINPVSARMLLEKIKATDEYAKVISTDSFLQII